MAVLQFYKNEACTELWQNVPVIELSPSRIGWGQTPAGAITLGEKTYKYFDVSMYSATALQDIPQIKAAPFMSKYTTITSQRYYCKNGYSLELGVTESSTIMQGYRYGSDALSFNEQTAGYSENSSPDYWVIGFTDPNDGTRYIGFTRVIIQSGYPWPGYVAPISCIEASFWESAQRPPYDYGTKPDGNGGQGDGKIPHTPIGFSSKPTISLPTGVHGLHAYRIDADAYDSLHSYLWGQDSTLAKNLWQKFVNSKTNPAGCIVACYRLPALFMPSGSVVNGIRLAGVKAPITNGTVQQVILGFTDYAVKIGHVEAPFGSWADYCGATVTISIPLCGEFTAPLEKVWDKDVFVKYRVDLSNGNLVGMACSGTCAEDGSEYSMEYLLGEMSGNVAYNVPISGGDDGTLARIGAVFGGISNVVSGFVGGVQDLSSVVGAMGATAQTGSPVASGAGFSSISRTGAMASRGAHYLSDIIMPPFQSHLINPNLSGNMSACSNGIAYAEYQIACIAYPPNYGDVMGYPARSSGGFLIDFTGGYGEFYVSADFDIHGATYEEKEEIVALLESGVFV